MSPQSAWQTLPQGCQDGIFPINDDNMALVVDGADDFAGN